MKKRKGAGRYRNIDKQTNRKVMSYEDVPIDDYDTTPVPNHIFKKLMKAIGIIFVSVAVLLIILNWNYLTSEQFANWFNYEFLGKSYGEGYPVRVVGTSVKSQNIKLINGSTLAYCSDTAFVTLNSTAGEILNEQHAFISPSLKCTGNYAIISNTGSKGYKIQTADKLVYEGNAEDKIFDADIASNGRYALMTQTDGYLSKLNVYLPDNKIKYTYSFADYYAYAVSLNDDGTKAAVAGLNAENGSIVSALYILDFNQKKYETMYTFEDDYIYGVCFFDNGNVIAIGDTNTYFINMESKSKTVIEYNSSTLTTFEVSKENGILLSLSQTPDGKECSLMHISKDGEITYKFSIGEKTEALSLLGNQAVVVMQGRAYLFDENGTPVSSAECGRDTKQICMVNSTTAYVLGNSKISMLTFSPD